MRFMRVVVDVELRIDALRSFTTLLAKDIREEYIMMVEDECGRIDISISDDDDGDDDDLGDDDDNDDDDSGGKCRDRDERDIILDDDDDNNMKHRSISSCRSILGEKRRKRRTSSSLVPHDVEKHLQSIITETKRKGTELEGTELLSSMMVDRGSRGSHGSDSHTEGGNPRSVASKRAKMIFGSSLQSKSIINTIAKPQSHLPIKMEHNNNNNNKSSNNNSSNSSNKSTVNSIINEKIRHDISSTVSITKSSISTTLKPTSLLDIDRLASSAIDPPSKSSSSSQASSSMQANRFKCGVCTERPSLPCAGRCGHICCQTCWVKWLQINATCPMCRAPADKNSVTRLIMKA